MDTKFIIAIVVIFIFLLIYYFFFRPFKIKERRLRKKNLMNNKPYGTETKISLRDGDIKYLEKDKEYTFDISVKIINSLNREELLNSFSFALNSPSFEVLGEPVVKLSFDKNVANSTFKVVPKKFGKTVLDVNLLQNYKIMDVITIDLTII